MSQPTNFVPQPPWQDEFLAAEDVEAIAKRLEKSSTVVIDKLTMTGWKWDSARKGFVLVDAAKFHAILFAARLAEARNLIAEWDQALLRHIEFTSITDSFSNMVPYNIPPQTNGSSEN